MPSLISPFIISTKILLYWQKEQLPIDTKIPKVHRRCKDPQAYLANSDEIFKKKNKLVKRLHIENTVALLYERQIIAW